MKKILFESKRLAKLAGIITENTNSVTEGETVEMLDLDGEENNIEVRVHPGLFLAPYIDIDGHGQEVPPLANHIYNNYVLGIAGDHDEKLSDIIDRIDIDYLDEDIEYVLKALGDDRFTTPNPGNNDSEDDTDDDPDDPWAEARANQERQELAKWRPGDR
jgi:hypothetical protein